MTVDADPPRYLLTVRERLSYALVHNVTGMYISLNYLFKIYNIYIINLC